jgi:Ca2+-binding RTX toxin-like protein
VISGKHAAIETHDNGAIHLINNGTIDGNIDCTVLGEKDVIINHGKINGSVKLYSSDDVFKGKGGTSGNIFCGSSNDQVTVGKGNVKLDVGSGNSTITGGPGHDQFIFDHKLTGQIDKIIDFNVSRDKIVLSEKDFAGLGPHGTLEAAHFHLGAPVNGHAQIDYFKSDGVLQYCPDGSAGQAYHFATLSSDLHLHLSNFLVTA